MIRRTFLRLAAACLIHPAFNWTRADPGLLWPRFKGVPIPYCVRLDRPHDWVPGTRSAWIMDEWANLPLHPEHHRRERPAG